jgi:hypothetical protein
MDSCSGPTSVIVRVISLVAKGKPRQRDSEALPKLLIIRLPSNQGKRPLALCKTVGLKKTPTLELLAEDDLADAPLHF